MIYCDPSHRKGTFQSNHISCAEIQNRTASQSKRRKLIQLDKSTEFKKSHQSNLGMKFPEMSDLINMQQSCAVMDWIDGQSVRERRSFVSHVLLQRIVDFGVN